MPSLQDTVVGNRSLPAAEVDGEVVIMDIDAGKYFSLDPVGSDIWRRIGEPVVVRDLCEALATDYNAASEIVQSDVLALLDTLAVRGLVQIETAPGGRDGFTA